MALNRRRDRPQALTLATESAEVGSWQGLVTLAYLYERLGRPRDAESLYVKSAERYDNPSQLFGFYYRTVHNRQQMEFEKGWKTWLPKVFPEGLQPAPTSMTAKPAHGVIITKDSALVRKAGIQAGDIIVGLEGWRVDNLRQYRAINASFDAEHEEMKLAVWRGQIFQPTFTAPGRFMGVEFRSYPIQGWGE